MQFEQVLDALSWFCLKLLPILGVVLMIYLIIVAWNLILCLKSATKTLDEANTQIRKLDIPLNTVSELSKSIDSVHELTKESLKSFSLSIYEFLNGIKEWFSKYFKKDKPEKMVK